MPGYPNTWYQDIEEHVPEDKAQGSTAKNLRERAVSRY